MPGRTIAIVLACAGVLLNGLLLKAEEIVVYNTSGTTQSGVATAALADLGLNAAWTNGVRVTDNGSAVPCRIHQGQLSVHLQDVAPYAAKILEIGELAGPVQDTKGGVSIVEEGGLWVIRNGSIRLKMEKKTGVVKTFGRESEKGDGYVGDLFQCWIHPVSFYRMPCADGYSFTYPIQQTLDRTNVQARIVVNGPVLGEIEVTWRRDSFNLRELYRIVPGTDWYEVRVDIQTSGDVYEGEFLCGQLSGMSAKDIEWHPDRAKYIGLYSNYIRSGKYRRTPGYALAFNPATREGLGVAVPFLEDLDRLSYYATPPGDFHLSVRTQGLYWSDRKQFSGTFYPFLAHSPDEAEALAVSLKGRLELKAKGDGVLTKIKLAPDRVTALDIVRVEGEIMNPSPAEKTVPLKTHFLDRDVRREFTLKPGERRSVDLGQFQVNAKQAGPAQLDVQIGEGRPYRYGVEIRKRVEILKAEQDRLIYNTDEPGSIELQLKNNSASSQKVRLNCDLIRDIDTRESVHSKNVRLAPGEIKSLIVPFDTASIEYGVEGRVSVSQGREPLDTHSLWFGAATNWTVLYQRGSVIVGEGFLCADLGKDRFITVAHLDSEAQYILPEAESRDVVNRLHWMTEPAIEGFKALRRQGIRSEFYFDSAFVLPGRFGFDENPERLLFGKNGRPYFFSLFNIGYPKNRKYGYYVQNIFMPGFVEYVADQFVDLIGRHHWDMVFLDDMPVFRMQGGELNYKGEPAYATMGKDFQQAGGKWLTTLKQNVRKKVPEFTFAGNAGTPSETGPAVYQALDQCMWELGGGGAYITDRTHELGQWKGLQQWCYRFRKDRAATGCGHIPYCIHAPINHGGEVTSRMFVGLGLANRAQFSMGLGFSPLNLCWEPARQYLRFALRYSAFIYDPAIHEYLDEGNAMVSLAPAPDSVLYREFVYSKKLARDREALIVHLVNLPEDPYVWKTYVRPKEVKQMIIRIKPLPGYTCRRVLYLTPDVPEEVRSLTMVESKDQIECVIPALWYYGMIIAEFGR